MFDPRKESSLGSIVCSFGSGGGSERGDILGRHDDDDECKRILMGFVSLQRGWTFKVMGNEEDGGGRWMRFLRVEDRSST